MNYNRKDENFVYHLVSKNIRKQRKLKNWTQKELAKRCNYSEGFIMNIESNYHQTFSLGTLWTIANTLEIDIKLLFDEIDELVDTK